MRWAAAPKTLIIRDHEQPTTWNVKVGPLRPVSPAVHWTAKLSEAAAQAGCSEILFGMAAMQDDARIEDRGSSRFSADIMPIECKTVSMAACASGANMFVHQSPAGVGSVLRRKNVSILFLRSNLRESGYHLQMPIPDDITLILREIDQVLKNQGVAPHARPIMAVIEFGKHFGVSMPITKLPTNMRLPPDAPAELVTTSAYTDRIHRWYEEVYGDLIKTDFSQKAKVAVLADGDMWEMRIPLIYGMAVIEAKRELPKDSGNRIGTKVLDINACALLTGITESRLQHFSDNDLDEVYGLFHVGLDVRKAFDRFRKSAPMFAAAEDDWAAAVAHKTNQSPNWGQARWSSLQRPRSS